MIFNSMGFLIFFPIVLIIYYIVPKFLQNFWLLLASYWFYMSWSVSYGFILGSLTALTYLSGIIIGSGSNAAWVDPREEGEIAADFSSRVSMRHRNVTPETVSRKERMQRHALIFVLMILFSVLGLYKYADFVLANVSAVMSRLGHDMSIGGLGLVMPVGMSFFLFQAAGYLIDVYREEIPAEKDFIKYALFVSFFPSILSGPIGRAPMLLPQYTLRRSFDWDKVCEGFLLMLWGYFIKLVIADRAAILVNFVYGNYHGLKGWTIVLATVIYAVEIYCDFCGYSLMATGAAGMLGIRLMENFDCPYFSVSVQDFWRRWHISLSSWFRDYLYFPLGGSRCSVLRRYFNILVVFIVSGLWHGSQWSYIAWGAINGIYQIIGNILTPVRTLILRIFGFDKNVLNLKKNQAMAGSMRVYDSLAPRSDVVVPWDTAVDADTHYPTGLFGIRKAGRVTFKGVRMGMLKLIRIVITFVLIDFAWLFFRAAGLKDAFLMIDRVRFDLGLMELKLQALYNLGLDMKNFWLLIIASGILFMSDYVKYHGGNIRKWILARPMVIRELIIAAAILVILIFGIWGNSYDASSFIYFQY